MPGIIDQFWIALGYKVDNSGLDEMKRKADAAKESMLSFGGAIAGLVTGFVIRKIAEIGSQFEQNKIQIAGFLSALELSPNFNAGLEDAGRIIRKITADAARLPGEAEEYVEVFKTNAAYLKKGLPGSNADQIADWTNRLTAISKTVASNLDAAQIARESAQLLAVQGRAGGHNVLWQKLLPFLMQVKGQADITAQSFNAMTQPKRVELLTAAFDKLQPALDASANSFDAMWGAAVSGARQLFRIGTAGIFKNMKVALDQLNSLFVDQKGDLTDLGKSVTDAMKKVGSFVVNTIAWFVKLTGAFAQSKIGAWALKGGLLAIGTLLAGLASEKAALGILKLVSAFGNLKTMLTGGVLGMILLLAEDLYVFAQGGNSVSGMLYSKFKPALALTVIPLVALVAQFLKMNGILGLVRTGFLQLVAPMLRVIVLWGALNAPLLVTIATIGLVVGAIAGVIFIAYELAKHWDEIVANMKIAWEGFIDTVTKVPHDLAVAFGFSGPDAESTARVSAAGMAYGGAAGWAQPGADTMAALSHAPSASMTGAQALAPPAAGGAGAGAGTVQQTTTVGTVNIITNDPKEMKREWDKHVRNGQTKVAY